MTKKMQICMIIAVFLIIGMASFFFITRNHSGKVMGMTLTDLTGKDSSSEELEDTIITKKEFLKLVMNTVIKKAAMTFQKPKEKDELTFYIQLAENEGLIEKGAWNVQNVNEPISRIEGLEVIALADVNILKNEMMSIDFFAFEDIEELSEWEIKVVSHLVASGMLEENEYGILRPRESMTKNEVVRIVSCFKKEGREKNG